MSYGSTPSTTAQPMRFLRRSNRSYKAGPERHGGLARASLGSAGSPGPPADCPPSARGPRHASWPRPPGVWGGGGGGRDGGGGPAAHERRARAVEVGGGGGGVGGPGRVRARAWAPAGGGGAGRARHSQPLALGPQLRRDPAALIIQD